MYVLVCVLSPSRDSKFRSMKLNFSNFLIRPFFPITNLLSPYTDMTDGDRICSTKKEIFRVINQQKQFCLAKSVTDLKLDGRNMSGGRLKILCDSLKTNSTLVKLHLVGMEVENHFAFNSPILRK